MTTHPHSTEDLPPPVAARLPSDTGELRSSYLLRAVDLFEELSPEDLEQLSHATHPRHVRSGELVSAREPSEHAMFIVVDGQVELTRENAAPVIRLAAGDAWGEVELISGGTSAWTARAVEDSELLELDRDDFEAFVADRPGAMRRILAAVSRRAVESNQQLVADEARSSRGASVGRVCAVYSTRGGAGKTLLATRLALELSRRMPQRVALLDLDLLFDDAALQLDVAPPMAVGELNAAQIEHLDGPTMARLLAEHRDGLRVVVGATRPEDGERVTPAHVRAILTALKRQFLVTVVDCASTFSEPTLQALELADRVFVVCTPELVTLRDMRDLQRVLGQALNVERERVSCVLNHPLPAVGLTRSQFERALEQKMILEIEHAGEAAAKPSFARAIDELADELAPVQAPQRRGLRVALFGRSGHGH